mmetsp:Transcript_34588/g.70640  ORF Transcript_34588/g.70640 Transcript_34588/m.70640 type:complete len:212 (+) Transcript_34588:941-1576(+)
MSPTGGSCNNSSVRATDEKPACVKGPPGADTWSSLVRCRSIAAKFAPSTKNRIAMFRCLGWRAGTKPAPSSTESSKHASRISAWSCPPRCRLTRSAPKRAPAQAAKGCQRGTPHTELVSDAGEATPTAEVTSAAAPSVSFSSSFSSSPSAGSGEEGSGSGGGPHASSCGLRDSVRLRSFPTASSRRARSSGGGLAQCRSSACPSCANLSAP